MWILSFHGRILTCTHAYEDAENSVRTPGNTKGQVQKFLGLSTTRSSAFIFSRSFLGQTDPTYPINISRVQSCELRLLPLDSSRCLPLTNGGPSCLPLIWPRNLLVENRHGLIVNTEVFEANGNGARCRPGDADVSALEDQQIGGLIMWIPAGTLLLIVALVLLI
jgi:hypothetical protein